MKLLSSHFASGLLGALVSTALFSLTSMQAPFVVQSGSLGAPMGLGANSTLLGQQEILRTMSLVDLPDGNGGTVRTLRIEGVNVQIVNGLGATNGAPMSPNSLDPATTTVDGTGNLIIGYNEAQTGTELRTGSHNLIVGHQNAYESFGGIVAGGACRIATPYSSVTGGRFNLAEANYASVSGGRFNTASGAHSCVTGGELNNAVGARSAVGGGSLNVAGGEAASVSGGDENMASGRFAAVSGGSENEASGEGSCVTGGQLNAAFGLYGMVSGGSANITVGDRNWRGGECLLCSN